MALALVLPTTTRAEHPPRPCPPSHPLGIPVVEAYRENHLMLNVVKPLCTSNGRARQREAAKASPASHLEAGCKKVEIKRLRARNCVLGRKNRKTALAGSERAFCLHEKPQ